MTKFGSLSTCLRPRRRPQDFDAVRPKGGSPRLRLSLERGPDHHPMGDKNYLSLQQGSDIHCSARSSLLRAAHMPSFFGGLHGNDPLGHECYGHAVPPSPLLGKDRHHHRSPVYGKIHYGCWRRLDAGRVCCHECAVPRTRQNFRRATTAPRRFGSKNTQLFTGNTTTFDDIAFSPKPYQKPRIPI